MTAVKTDGTLWSWGYNGGRGTTGIPGIAHNAKISSPTQVGSDTNWAVIGRDHYLKEA